MIATFRVFTTCACALALTLAAAPLCAQELALRALDGSEMESLQVSDTAPPRSGRSYEARSLTDGLLWSAWASQQEAGAWLEVRFPATRYVQRLQILTGDAADGRTWKNSRRARVLRIHHDRGVKEVHLEDSRNLQNLDFEEPLVSRRFRLEIVDSYGRGFVTISELKFFEPEDIFALKPGLRQEIQGHLAGLRAPETRPAAAAALERIGAPAMTWLVPMLSDPDTQLRMAATELMLRSQRRDVAPRVRQQFAQLVKDPDALQDPHAWHYAQVALRYLGWVGDGPSVEVALSMYQRASWRRIMGDALLSMLAQSGHPKAMPTLEAAVRADEHQAQLAAPGFARQGVPGTAALDKLAQDPDRYVRLRATGALAWFKDHWPAQAVERLIQDPDPWVRSQALLQVGRSGHLRGLPPLLLAAQDPNSAVRMASAESLGGYQAQDATDALHRLAQDPDSAVRQAAIKGLERQGLPALGALLGLLATPGQHPDNAEQTEAALGSLARQDPKLVLEQLRQQMDPKKPRLSQHIALLMNQCGPEGLEVLTQMMRSQDTRLSFYARRALERAPRQTTALLLRDLDPRHTPKVEPSVLSRYLAVAATNRDPRLLPVMENLAADPRPRVRADVMRALRGFASPRAQALLLKGLEDPWRESREQAIVAIGEQRIHSATPRLMQMIEERDPVSLRAVWALGHLRDPRSLELLQGLLVHPRSTMRQYACVALGQIGDTSAMPSLEATLRDEDEMVRLQARRALHKLEGYALSRR